MILLNLPITIKNMARRKTIIRVPFLKIKINKQTIFNITGIIIIGFALILLLSFIGNLTQSAKGEVLRIINQAITTKFGVLSLFLPVILVLISTYFFNTKKFRVFRPNITFGLILVLFSLLGITQSGEVGSFLLLVVGEKISVIGAIIFFGVFFLIGLLLAFDTSIDVFLLLISDTVKSVYNLINAHLLGNKRAFTSDKSGDDKIEFIGEDHPKNFNEKKLPVTEKKPSAPAKTTAEANTQLVIKPLTETSTATWVYPPINLLSDITMKEADRGDTNENAFKIEKTLDSFGIRARVVEVNKGPAVTQYALRIAMGIKLSRITALSNDLALALAAPTGQVRIEAPIPGRDLVGIEIPNRRPELVTLKKMLSSTAFENIADPLLVPLGLDVSGTPIAASLAQMPHVLIAGTTGSGKSVLLNSWISTFLFRTKPDELRMILVDPKRVEMTLYNGIAHLLTEVIVEQDKIISALRWTVSEMETRYKLFSKAGARNIEGYNQVIGVEKKPYIIFIIDELADLMVYAPGDVEELITRIAQMARATGIHLVLATQRPSVDVITGLMKANIPCRIAFNVSSMIDSRVIIDTPGAEKLLGRGDMLYLPPDQAKPKRIQGPYISEKEVNQVVRFLRMQVPEVQYTTEVTEQDVVISGRGGTQIVNGAEKDVLYDKAVEIIMQQDKASASLLQRRLSIGYARAARILDQLESAGLVGPAEGAKPRDVIKRRGSSEPAADS